MGGRRARTGGRHRLCSEAASFVTCSELVIDGGFSQVFLLGTVLPAITEAPSWIAWL